jgi:hypothetical protein
MAKYQIPVFAHIRYTPEIEVSHIPVTIVVEAPTAEEAGDKAFIAMKDATLEWSGWDRANLKEVE